MFPLLTNLCRRCLCLQLGGLGPAHAASDADWQAVQGRRERQQRFGHSVGWARRPCSTSPVCCACSRPAVVLHCGAFHKASLGLKPPLCPLLPPAAGQQKQSPAADRAPAPPAPAAAPPRHRCAGASPQLCAHRRPQASQLQARRRQGATASQGATGLCWRGCSCLSCC